MKRKNTYWIIVLALFIPNLALSQMQICHTFYFNPDNLYFESFFENSQVFTKVCYFKELKRTYEIGNPELPVMCYNFIIPFDKYATHVYLINKTYSNYVINHPIYPVQEQRTTCIDCSVPDFCPPNSQVYSLSTAFPLENVISIEHGFFDGNHILTLGICPFEYYPTANQIKMLTSFDIVIDLGLDTIQRQQNSIQRLRHSQDIYDYVLHNLVENKEHINGYKSTQTLVEEIRATRVGLPAYEYVIVTPNALKTAFSDFIKWKRQKGIDIGVVTIEDILSSYQGDEIFPGNEIYDDAGKLRQYLYEARWQGTVYVLLAGNYPSMPIRKGWNIDNTLSNDYIIPTDLYFGDFDGNWNVDGDTCYGEPNNDLPDYHPDIYVGRLLCSSEQDVLNWVNKMLVYEKNPGSGNTSYLTEAFIMEADQGQQESQGDSIASYLTSYNPTIWKELPNYNSNTPYFPKGSDVVNEWNTNHYGFVGCFNHGGTGNGESGIVTMRSGSNQNPQWKLQAQEQHPYSGAEPDYLNGLDNLNNINNPFVLYTVSCWINPYDRTSSFNNNSARNFGEAFTVDNLAGGIAFLGNCRNGYLDPSYNLFEKFVYWHELSTNDRVYSHLGLLEALSKRATFIHNQYDRHVCYSHNLIGDPECILWNCIPENLSVAILPQQALLFENQDFQITINNLGFNNKAIVTLYKAGELYDRIEVVGNQQNSAVAVFNDVNPQTVGNITFTVTSYGFIPYQQDVPVYGNCEIEINTTKVWQNDTIINCNTIVNNNAILTIMAEIQLSTNSKILVKPGGRLIIDGGKLSSSKPNSLWPGIQVWGNRNMHQQEINGSYAQGYLEMKNGAIIENAECAVTLWHPDDYNSTGGIIHATNSTFRNNAMAVRAIWYDNYNPNTGSPRSYNARFRNCDFIIDSAYLGTTTFYRHVDLAYVKGISFYGCRFSVSRFIPGVSLWCDGIRGSQASFKVESFCTGDLLPCIGDNLVRSSFSGFHTGVYASNDGSGARTFMVRNSDFLNNDRGIYALDTDYATILDNNFSIGCGAECTFGIYTDHVSGFCIENNTFSPWHKQNCPAFGVAVISSCSTNEVYLNQFSGLMCANVAIGQNFQTGSGGLPSSPQGLTYSCNDNTWDEPNTIDFCVVEDGNTSYSGIQQAQGSSYSPAGNTFGGTFFHFYNDGDFIVNYYYKQNQSNQIPSLVNNVSLSGTNSTNNCLPHYGDIQVLRTTQEKEELEDAYLAAHTTYQSLKQIYESRIDGGSTSAEVSDITNATSSDMWRLRAKLLGHSPYLSNEVLTAAADRDNVFTHSVLFEILSANPDELKKDTLISYLENKVNPLPDYMIGLLRMMADGATARTALEAQMTKYAHDYRLAAGDIVRSNLNDSIANPTELRTWLAAMEDIAADRMIIASLMQEGNYTDALALANMLPNLYELQGDQLADHVDYMRLLNLYNTLQTTNRTVFELTETETEMVEEIADEGMGTSRSMAEALLSSLTENRGDRLYFCPSIPKPKDGGKGVKTSFNTMLNEALGFDVNISPSPASTWVSVDYTLPAGAERATLTLTSMLGVKVMEVEISGNRGSKVLDLRGLSDGVYGYTIRCGGNAKNGKIVIAK